MHTYAWGITVALAALMGVLASPSIRMTPAGRWLAGLVVCIVAVNFTMSLQQLQSARTLAMWGAYVFAFIYCAGLKTGEGDASTSSWDERVLPGAVALAGTLLAVHGLYQ
ncbi:MAG TPA: hypothetical protein VFE84_07630, partial [Patescibacteria group bacterium]|nr:hypothetical protein [Patescibacteria group bacterium]